MERINVNIIGIGGLILIIVLYILMKKSQKKHPEKYEKEKITIKQALLIPVAAINHALPIRTAPEKRSRNDMGLYDANITQRLHIAVQPSLFRINTVIKRERL